MVNWAIIIPIIVAIVPLIGVFGPVLISNYIESLNTPSVDIVIKPDISDHTKTLIEVSNDGLVSATNLSLAVESPENITSVTKKSGAADVLLTQLPNNNQKLKLGMPQNLPISVSSLELEIPRLAHGDGSLIELEISNNKSLNSPYTPVATFDQGSSVGKTEEEYYASEASEGLCGMLEYIGGFSFFLFYYLTFFAFLFYYLFRWSYRRTNKLRFKDFIALIREQIMTIHSTINMDPKTQHDFDDFIQTWRQKSLPTAKVQKRSLYDLIQARKQKSYTIKKIIDYKEMKDYVIIENLYAKLLKRISYIKKYSDLEDIKRYNNESLRFVEKALLDINWNKH
jgi:hypothetical protein